LPRSWGYGREETDGQQREYGFERHLRADESAWPPQPNEEGMVVAEIDIEIIVPKLQHDIVGH
jgi:hypothetical protein